MDKLKSLAAFVDHCVAGLCDAPETIKLEKTEDEKGLLITLTVPSDQMSKLIGRNGKTIKAMTTLVRSLGIDLETRAALKIVEIDENGEVVERKPRMSSRKASSGAARAPKANTSPAKKTKEDIGLEAPKEKTFAQPEEKKEEIELTLSADDIDI